MSEPISEKVQEVVDTVAGQTKRGFDPAVRLRNRKGLRKGTVTIYLDEETGPKLGWATDLKDVTGVIRGRDRQGVMGELEISILARDSMADQYQTERALQDADESMTTRQKADAEKTYQAVLEGFNERIAGLEKQRDDLIAELTGTALVFSLRAVPPVIQKNCRRKARETLGIEAKGVPADKIDDFNEAFTAHLMSEVIVSVTDNESGGVNTETTYADCIEYLEQLPPGQFARLDDALGRVQFTDSISREIEGQEDFS